MGEIWAGPQNSASHVGIGGRHPKPRGSMETLELYGLRLILPPISQGGMMRMIRRILMTAALAGALAGLVASLAERAEVIPLIRLAQPGEEATLVQIRAETPSPAGTYMATEPQSAADWEPTQGFARIVQSVLANMAAGVGFGLVLVLGFTFATRAGPPIDWQQGILWGLAGFAVFALAPGLDLSPAPPNIVQDELVLRRLWLIGTVASTALGLGLAVFAPKIAHKLAGLVLIAIPHLIGAPPRVGPSAVPPGLAFDFWLASLAGALVFWMVLGGLAATVFTHLKEP